MNLSCFEDLSLTPVQVSSFSLGMMRSLPQETTVVKIRSIFVKVIDNSFAWGFFDCSAVVAPKTCGFGACCISRMNIIYVLKQV